MVGWAAAAPDSEGDGVGALLASAPPTCVFGCCPGPQVAATEVEPRTPGVLGGAVEVASMKKRPRMKSWWRGRRQEEGDRRTGCYGYQRWRRWGSPCNSWWGAEAVVLGRVRVLVVAARASGGVGNGYGGEYL